MNQLFASSGLSTGASKPVLSMNSHVWFPLVLTGLISLLSKRLLCLLQHHNCKASIFQCSTFFMVQFSHSYMITEKPYLWLHRPLLAKWYLCFLIHCLWKWKSLSHVWLFVTPWTVVHGLLQTRILEWVAFPFSRRSSQPRDRIQVSHIAGQFFTNWATRGRPRILEWVAYHFSRGSSQTRNRTGVSCIEGGFFTNWAIREAEYTV